VGILFADHLPVLGFRRTRALSALPLVCRREAAPQRFLAQLFVNAGALPQAEKLFFSV
jgi:hypothetical protein